MRGKIGIEIEFYSLVGYVRGFLGTAVEHYNARGKCHHGRGIMGPLGAVILADSKERPKSKVSLGCSN